MSSPYNRNRPKNLKRYNSVKFCKVCDYMDSLKVSEVLENFAFEKIRHKQKKVIEELCSAFNSGCKYIMLEAPTVFGKSAVGISVAKTLGSSYVCTPRQKICRLNM